MKKKHHASDEGKQINKELMKYAVHCSSKRETRTIHKHNFDGTNVQRRILNLLFLFPSKLVPDNLYCFFCSSLVPVTDGQNESANTLLSSFQRSPSTDNSTQEMINISKENGSETLSTIIPEQKPHSIERHEQLTPNLSEEPKKPSTSNTPPSSSSELNPEATPFSLQSTNNIDRVQSISTGDDSDDESDSNETPVTSGKSQIE